MIPNNAPQNSYNSRIVFDEQGLKFSNPRPFTHNTGLSNRPHKDVWLARFQRLWLRLANRVFLRRKPFQHVLWQGQSPVLTLVKRLPSLNCDTLGCPSNNPSVFRPEVSACSRQQVDLPAIGLSYSQIFPGTCPWGRSQPPLQTLDLSHSWGSHQPPVSRSAKITRIFRITKRKRNFGFLWKATRGQFAVFRFSPPLRCLPNTSIHCFAFASRTYIWLFGLRTVSRFSCQRSHCKAGRGLYPGFQRRDEIRGQH